MSPSYLLCSVWHDVSCGAMLFDVGTHGVVYDLHGMDCNAWYGVAWHRCSLCYVACGHLMRTHSDSCKLHMRLAQDSPGGLPRAAYNFSRLIGGRLGLLKAEWGSIEHLYPCAIHVWEVPGGACMCVSLINQT